jgi:Tetracyclin repressor-like, C-terminal domain
VGPQDHLEPLLVDLLIAEGPFTDTAQILWASVHGWVSLELGGIGFVEDQDAVFDRAYTALLRGLRP